MSWRQILGNSRRKPAPVCKKLEKGRASSAKWTNNILVTAKAALEWSKARNRNVFEWSSQSPNENLLQVLKIAVQHFPSNFTELEEFCQEYLETSYHNKKKKTSNVNPFQFQVATLYVDAIEYMGTVQQHDIHVIQPNAWRQQAIHNPLV